MTPNEKDTQGPRVLQSVDRAFRAVELLAHEADGLPLGEMATRLGLKPQTLQGILRSLQAHGLVLQTERGGVYILGPRIHELSRLWLERCDRAMLARDIVGDFARKLGEPVMLSELLGGRLNALVQVSGGQLLSVSQNQLQQAPMHTMATGKLLLAFAPQKQREALAAAEDFTRRGPNTIPNVEELLRNLEQVRERGYALCDEEASADVVAVAVPVRDVNDDVVAAIGAAVPKSRYSADRVEVILDELRDAAAQIERRWGRV